MLTNSYTILSLPSPTPNTGPLPPSTIKRAYRLALLSHHPDKSARLNSHPLPTPHPQPNPPPTIDAITTAYRTLSNPASRASLDRHLRLRPPSHSASTPHSVPPTGVESVDLDEMAFDAAQRGWVRGCRCGMERAFVVKEEELEREVERVGVGQGEVLVGCAGCSLWVRVLFGVEGG